MKKYLLISEVAELLNVPMANLRYLESTHPKIQIQKIRGRRYYKESDIAKIAYALGIDYETKLLVKTPTPSYISKKPVVTTSVSLVKASVHSVQEFKANLPMLEEKHELAAYESHLPMVAEKHEVEAYKKNLPQLAERHEVEVYKENFPDIVEKHEVSQLDLFSKIEPSSHAKQEDQLIAPLQKHLVQNKVQSHNPSLDQAKKRMEEIRDRLKKIAN